MDDIFTQDLLNELLEYEAGTGKLFWKPRSKEHFLSKGHSAEHTCHRWNSRYAGKEAFASCNVSGYRQGSIFDRKALGHRVAWLMVNGEKPEQIDHINGDRSDNRLVNLRSVTHQENGRNQSLASSNTSGRCGVTRDKKWGKWMAFIRVDGRAMTLGRFVKFEDAVAAREQAETKYGFHKNHGKSRGQQNEHAQ